MTSLKTFLLDESGQALAEYGLVIALIAVVIIGALTTFKEARETLFNNILDKLSAVIG